MAIRIAIETEKVLIFGEGDLKFLKLGRYLGGEYSKSHQRFSVKNKSIIGNRR